MYSLILLAMAKILIVDDSEDVLEIITLILQKEGYEVEGAASKNKVMNRLSTFVPDIILLDVRLHGEDGRELCREIKQKNSFKSTPIILLSASPELLKDYEECEAFGIVEKPFNINVLIKKI